jgi:signal transduction histidine kinase
VFENLLSYSKDNAQNPPEIYITAAARPQRMLEIIYTDKSVILSQNTREHIFDGFLDKDISQTSHTGVMNMSMSIVKNIVELHGGEMFVKSSEQEGTTFSFTLQREME